MDGVIVAANTGDADRLLDIPAEFGISATQFATIMNQLWNFRLNTQVIKAGDQWHPAPDNSQPFQVADFQIDYARVYK
jgi:hypothetical protein